MFTIGNKLMENRKREFDESLMRKALELAHKAYEKGEVPVGALIADSESGEVIAEAYNLRESNKSATAHAEVLAIEQACERLGGWRLSGYTLYVTLEPCPMCAGALINSRLDRVVFGASDPLAGCCGSVINFNSYPFNHSFDLTIGVLADECLALLQSFFAERRNKKELS